SGLWIIPDNTTITIELPPGAEINNTVEPLAQITTAGSRKAINWQGYKSANNLSLTYILWKKIQPVIDISSITNFLFKTTQGMLLIVIVLLILAGVIWQRKKIGLGIEEFVEKHSLIKEE
ncbi:MAG: hypothetical protein NTY48_01030, partial [Candidatus Diapherotrites archaeon]|nr:hypothetical protein [Candidatus Diapherotrites archaeon]